MKRRAGGLIQRDLLLAVLSNETKSGEAGRSKDMLPKSVMLSLLCAAATVGVAMWLAVGHQARLKLGEENKALQQQLGQMAGVVAENERLSNLVVQASRSQSLPDEQLKELLRLRGEMGVLRHQCKELESLSKENLAARAALESSLKTQNAGAGGAAATTNYWPRDSWAFAGYASPDAALQSFIWARMNGDLKALRVGTTGEAQKELEQDLARKSEGEVSLKAMADSINLKSVRMHHRSAEADDTVVIQAGYEDGNITYAAKLLMKKVGNEWKLSNKLKL